jgi:hypothetical protein
MHLKYFKLIILIFLTSQLFGQKTNEKLSIISGCDTNSINTHIGEITYFGEKMEKAKAFPQLSCNVLGKRYVVLWVPSKKYKKRSLITEKQLNEYVFQMKNNGFEKYPCFAFSIDQKETQVEWNKVLYELKFPSLIEVFMFKEDKWIKLFEKEVNSHQEYGELQLNVIKKY